MLDTTIRGRFLWHELMTTDIPAAGRFFGKVLGWKIETSPHDPSYQLFAAGGRPRGGLTLLPSDLQAVGTPPCWLVYIGTPDVDATVRTTVELGGRVLTPAAQMSSVGRFALLQDPQGAVFAVFTPSSEPSTPRDKKPAVGDFSWHELATTDWAAALAFYQELFGWEKTESMDMGPEMGTYQMFGWQGRTLGGMFNQPKTSPVLSHWLPYAMVRDSKKIARSAGTSGGKVASGPMEVPGGDWIVQCFDPQGALFAVHSLKPAAEKPVPEKATAPAVRVRPKTAAAGRSAESRKKAGRARKAKATPAKKAGVARKARPRPAKKAVAARRPARRTSRKTAAPPRTAGRGRTARRRR